MAAERAQHILVIGIGNAESGDDGVGSPLQSAFPVSA
jgi:Ni,Fe-hydrogenase maturation factor